MVLLRNRVLSLYRSVLRLGRTWVASSPSETTKERQYILHEAQTLFRQNKSLLSAEDIEQHIQEADARISIALHYRNPYPRPVNIPQNVLAPGGNRTHLTVRKRSTKQSTPIYIKSYDKS